MKALEKAEIDEEVDETEEVEVAPPDKKPEDADDSDTEFGSPKLSPDPDANTASAGMYCH